MAQSPSKRQLIEQSTSTMVIVASIAVFVTIFSLISAHALWDKLVFQSHVITAKTAARNQLNEDVTSAQKLTNSYHTFNGTSSNLLGGAVTGDTNDNAKIVLDALPSSYDYPALVTSIQSLLSNQGVSISSIGGTDESATVSSTSGGKVVVMPFTFTVSGPYANVQNVVNVFEKSIRPFQVLTMNLSGSQSNVTLTVSAQTFFQPATQFKITTETIK